MPRLTYKPEGAEPRVWDFAFGRLMSPERIAIEKATGMGWAEVQQGFWENRGAVIHAVLWVLLKRDIPTLTASQVEFCDDDIDRDLSDEEAAQAIAKIEEAGGPANADEVEVLETLTARLAEAEADPKVQD